MDITIEDLQKFMEVADKVIPGFKVATDFDRLLRKLDETKLDQSDEVLLQEEQNLNDMIGYNKNQIKKINDEIDKHSSLIKEYLNSLEYLEKNTKELENKRTLIHKQWIYTHPISENVEIASLVKTNAPTSENNEDEKTLKELKKEHVVRKAFDVIFDLYCATNSDIENHEKFFKRFDNVANGRSKSTVMFGDKKFDINYFLVVLNQTGHIDLEKKLRKFHELAVKKEN